MILLYIYLSTNATRTWRNLVFAHRLFSHPNPRYNHLTNNPEGSDYHARLPTQLAVSFCWVLKNSPIIPSALFTCPRRNRSQMNSGTSSITLTKSAPTSCRINMRRSTSRMGSVLFPSPFQEHSDMTNLYSLMAPH